MKIITDFPVWSILICIGLSLLFTFLLYGRSKQKNELSKLLLWTLYSLSFLSVFFLSLLLFSPYIKRNSTTIEKPVIVFAQDNTASIRLSEDSSFYKKDYPEKLRKLIKDINKKYDVQTYSFSNKIDNNELNFDYNGKETDIDHVLNEIRERFVNKNLGAVVLASDGIYNYGNNPLNHSNTYSFPIYTLALGDTIIKKDVKISNIIYNKTTYLGNTFPVEFTISADQCKGERTQVKVSNKGRILLSKEIHFTSNTHEQHETLTIEAKEVGLQQYTIEVTPLKSEVTYENNIQQVYIHVIDKKQRIILLAGAPHPDISALKQIIEPYGHYELHSSLVSDFKEPVQNYNLLILHQIPFIGGQGEELIRTALHQKIPILFILGMQTNIGLFNQLNLGISIQSNINTFTENQSIVNTSFPLFTFEDDLKKKMEQYPPLLSPFGSYQLTPRSQTLAFAKIGSVVTQQPLITFIEGEQSRMGFICGEGIWKWKLSDYAQNESFDKMNSLFGKIIQYLSSSVHKSQFLIHHKEIFKENEPVLFEGVLYNENYEPITIPEVSINIKDTNGHTTEYFFNKKTEGYTLSLGTLNPGSYTYKASTTFGGKSFVQNGAFVVEKMNAEEMNLVADHTLLYALSQKTGGQMLTTDQMNQLEKLLVDREDIKPTAYYQQEYTDMLTLIWTFIGLILFFTIHWFLRKYNGFI